MEHGSQIGTSFSAIEKTLFCMPFVPEIEEREKKKTPNHFFLYIVTLVFLVSNRWCYLIGFCYFL